MKWDLLSLSITGEGQTLDKVILALSYCKAKQCSLEYWQVYVALSRVKKREGIQLLLTGDDEVMKWWSIQYLHDLKPDASVQAFFAGFKPATWIDTKCDPTPTLPVLAELTMANWN